MSVLLVGCNSTVLLCGTPGKPRSLNGTSNSTSFLVKFSTFSMKLLKADLSLCLSSLSAYGCKKNKNKTRDTINIFRHQWAIFWLTVIWGMEITTGLRPDSRACNGTLLGGGRGTKLLRSPQCNSSDILAMSQKKENHVLETGSNKTNLLIYFYNRAYLDVSRRL